jgi:hypothetical protein
VLKFVFLRLKAQAEPTLQTRKHYSAAQCMQSQTERNVAKWVGRHWASAEIVNFPKAAITT